MMLHAVFLMIVTAILSKLGLRPLTEDEKARLPPYYVRAERIQGWVFGITYGLICLIVIGAAVAEALGY